MNKNEFYQTWMHEAHLSAFYVQILGILQNQKTHQTNIEKAFFSKKKLINSERTGYLKIIKHIFDQFKFILMDYIKLLKIIFSIIANSN